MNMENINKNKPPYMEIEFDKSFKISNVTKVIEVNEDKINIRLTSGQLLLRGENFDLTTIDLNNRFIEGKGLITKIKYIKRNSLNSLIKN